MLWVFFLWTLCLWSICGDLKQDEVKGGAWVLVTPLFCAICFLFSLLLYSLHHTVSLITLVVLIIQQFHFFYFELRYSFLYTNNIPIPRFPSFLISPFLLDFLLNFLDVLLPVPPLSSLLLCFPLCLSVCPSWSLLTGTCTIKKSPVIDGCSVVYHTSHSCGALI